LGKVGLLRTILFFVQLNGTVITFYQPFHFVAVCIGSLLMQSDIIIPLVIYLALVFGVSIYAYSKREKINSLSDYFIGNRKMGGFLLAMTLTATYISASSFIGGPGAAYKYGLGWVLLSMIQLPAVWLSLGVLGKKFAIIARHYNAVTLNDLLIARYRSKALVFLASFCLLIAFMAAMTVQFIGAARLLETAIGLDYRTGLIIFGVSTALYTSFGGFRASILNDALQGIVMMIGAILLLVAVIYAAGGIPAAISRLEAIDPQLISPQGVDNILTFPFMASFWVLVCFGVVGLPHTAVRCMAYKDSKAVHQGIIIGTVIVAVLMVSMHLAGVLGRAIIPDLTIPDTVIPALMVKVLPPFAAGIFLAAPLAAIMSTVNSQLLQSSATIVKDLYLNLFPHKIADQTKLTRLSSIFTFILGLLLIVCAINPPDMLIWLNLLAFGGLQVVFLWPLILGLYWPRANAYGAIGSIIIGVGCYTLLLIIKPNMYGFLPIVPSLFLSGVAFWTANTLAEKFCYRSGREKPVDWSNLSS
jgi:sodium/pantothenate symporter